MSSLLITQVFFTVLAYLNGDFEGGELQITTSPPVAYKPLAGDLVLLDQRISHAGLRVTSGTKTLIRSEMFHKRTVPEECETDIVAIKMIPSRGSLDAAAEDAVMEDVYKLSPKLEALILNL